MMEWVSVRSDKSPNGTGVGVIKDVHMCNDGDKMVMKEWVSD